MIIKAVGILVAALAITYALIPVLFRLSTRLQRQALFMNSFTPALNLSQPNLFGLLCSRSIRLFSTISALDSRPIELGVWHVVANSAVARCNRDSSSNETLIYDSIAFADDRPILLYLHGNRGTRALTYRVNFYKRLAYKLDYHIITFDYRGFGDSSQVEPSADGVTRDALAVYDWLLEQPGVNKERVTVWGHSLGSAVAVRLVASLPVEREPRRLVLESSFDKITNVMSSHYLAAPFKVLPYFERLILAPITNSQELNFDSASLIGHIRWSRILMLHSADDPIVSIKHSESLYREALSQLGPKRVHFIGLDATLGLGHVRISTHEETMNKVVSFIEQSSY